MKKKIREQMKDKDIVKLVLNSAGLILALFLMVIYMPKDLGKTDPELKAKTKAFFDFAKNDDNREVLGTRTGKVRNTAAKLAGKDNKKEEKKEVKKSTKATVLIYMIGSDLESTKHEATDDISEMLSSGIGTNVNVLIQTMGTKKWINYGISSGHSQIYSVRDGNLDLIKDDLKQLDSTSPETLSSFIKYGKENYPAERYILLFWDHGAGPVFGFGCDEWRLDEESLTLDEMQLAFNENYDVYFDLIGMDACVMANIETAHALKDYCDKSVLSEDYVSSIGWDYCEWMKAFEKDPAMDTGKIGSLIIDSAVNVNETLNGGRSTTMVLVDESKSAALFDAWKDYAYANESLIFRPENLNINVVTDIDDDSSRTSVWKRIASSVSLGDYYLNDVRSLMKEVDETSDEAVKLKQALDDAVIHYGHTSDTNSLTGMSVTIPYADEYFYEKLHGVFTRCGFDEEYVNWLGSYTDAMVSEEFVNKSIENGEDKVALPTGTPGLETEEGTQDDGSEYKYIEGNWKFDESEQVWYFEDGDIMYLYDESDKNLYYYNKKDGNIYRYDEENDGEWDWYD